MKAVRYHAPGGPEKLGYGDEDRPSEPEHGQVLVKVHAVGLIWVSQSWRHELSLTVLSSRPSFTGPSTRTPKASMSPIYLAMISLESLQLWVLAVRKVASKSAMK